MGEIEREADVEAHAIQAGKADDAVYDEPGDEVEAHRAGIDTDEE